MDHKSMYQFVYDMMEQNLETYSDEELVTEVKDYYPELLEPRLLVNWKQLHLIMESVSDEEPTP